MTKIEPLRNNVLLKSITTKVTKGGLHMPATVDEKFSKGEVLAVGPGRVIGSHLDQLVIKPIPLSPGDVVLFTKPASVKVENDEYLIDFADIHCKWVDTKNTEVN